MESLRTVIGLTKLIGTGRDIVPLTDQEKHFLLEFGGEEQMVAMSEGIIENSKVHVYSGPLKGREGCIRKIGPAQAQGLAGDRDVRQAAEGAGGAGDRGEDVGQSRNAGEYKRKIANRTNRKGKRNESL